MNEYIPTNDRNASKMMTRKEEKWDEEGRRGKMAEDTKVKMEVEVEVEVDVKVAAKDEESPENEMKIQVT